MDTKKRISGGYLNLTAANTLYYAGCGVYTYLSVYLRTGPGFTKAQIGILLALGQIVASIAPIFWGYLADRSKNRNTIWMLVVAGAAVGALLVPLSRRFLFVAMALLFVNCFQSSVASLQDSVSSELCKNNGWDLGRSRMAGTLSYAVTTFLAGVYLAGGDFKMFVVYAAIFALSLVPIAFVPKVPGYQSGGRHVPYRVLFSEPKLVVVYVVSFFICLTTSFYYSFFSLYFISPEVGGTTALFGICNALASIAEFPVLLYASKAIKKWGLTRVMVFSMTMLALRWFLIGLVPDPYALCVINTLHGVSYGLIALCVVLLINEYVQPEFRASGQSFNTMLVYGLTRVIASSCGGFLSEAFPFAVIFIVLGSVVVVTTAAYFIYLKRRRMLTA
ncbi:MAG: MFS transporter [Clostridiales bacterium]|nr:MFS transporter [Clostridiales bacterium]